jgi:Domain of unknown function (DUF3127)
MSNYDITGEIIVINDTQEFASGFTKREFVIRTNEDKYPQNIKLELTKDACAKLDAHNIGDTVTVAFNVQGNEYNGKYYVNLRAWKIAGEGSAQSPPPARQPNQNGAKPPSQTATADELDEEDEDDIPF